MLQMKRNENEKSLAFGEGSKIKENKYLPLKAALNRWGVRDFFR